MPEPGPLEEVGRDIDAQSAELTLTEYVDLVRRFSEVVSSSSSLDTARRNRLLIEYILTALSRAAKAPLVERMSLLRLLPMPSETPPDSAQLWAARRDEAVARWLEVWKEVRELIDPLFDPADRPSLNVAPPSGRIRRPGTAPEEIADPADREAYEQALRQNADRLRQYSSQLELREWLRQLEAHVPVFLSHAYTIGPDATEDLERLLQDGDVPEPLATSVLGEVRSHRAGA